MATQQTEAKAEEKAAKNKKRTEYKTYRAVLQFRNGLAGGHPAQDNLAGEHAKRFMARQTNELYFSRNAEGETSPEAAEKWLKGLTSIFRRDEDGPYLMGYQVLAMLRDALKLTKLSGRTFLKFMIQNGGITIPEMLRIVTPTGETDINERPVSPEVRGERVSTIARFEVAKDASLEFEIGILSNGEMDKKVLKQLLTVGGECGLGSFRHLGYGKFDLVELKP